jgi:hypothetical protein
MIFTEVNMRTAHKAKISPSGSTTISIIHPGAAIKIYKTRMISGK